MKGSPIDLDDRRSDEARKATKARRLSSNESAVQYNSARHRTEQLESLLTSLPAETLAEVAAKALYVVRLYARTKDGQSDRRRKLIDRTIDDLVRLAAHDRSRL